jgi:hypothetical protein
VNVGKLALAELGHVVERRPVPLEQPSPASPKIACAVVSISREVGEPLRLIARHREPGTLPGRQSGR